MVHACCCTSAACKEEGTEPGLKLPGDLLLRNRWLEKLGIDPGSFFKLDGRVSVLHFHPSDLKAKNISPYSLKPAVVTVCEGAVPSQSDEQIRESVRGARGGRLKAVARCAALQSQLRDKHEELQRMQEEREKLTGQTKERGTAGAAARSANRVAGGERAGDAKRTRNVMDHTILEGMDTPGAISICGLHNHQCLEVRLVVSLFSLSLVL